MTVEHRGVRLEARAVGGAHHIEPFLAADLVLADQVAHATAEDFRAAARQRAEARLLELGQHLVDALAADLGEMRDLAGGERLDVHVGSQLLEGAHHLEEILERQVGVLAADDVDLGDAADGQSSASLLHDLVDRESVRVGVALVVAEGAEQAAVAAHVGVVDVTVADEIDLVTHGAGAGEVGHGTQGEDVVALKQRGGLRGIEAVAGRDGLPGSLEAGAHGKGEDVTGVHGIDSRRVSCSGPRPAPTPSSASSWRWWRRRSWTATADTSG